MQYRHVVVSRKFKFGPGEEFPNLEAAKEKVAKVRNNALSKISLAGFYKAVEEITEEKTENSITLKFLLKCPEGFLED